MKSLSEELLLDKEEALTHNLIALAGVLQHRANRAAELEKARDAAVELLNWIKSLRDDHGGYLDRPYPLFEGEDLAKIDKVIALLRGEDDEAE